MYVLYHKVTDNFPDFPGSPAIKTPPPDSETESNSPGQNKTGSTREYKEDI